MQPFPKKSRLIFACTNATKELYERTLHMYQFNIIKLEDGGYKFELGAIQMLVEDFIVNNGNHFLTNPQKAIAYFNINGNIYGVTNDAHKYNTAEAFYEKMNQQYMIFTTDGSKASELRHTA